MTLVSSGSTITFAGDGVQNLFDFNFRIFRAEDLCAVVRNNEGQERSLVSGSDFKIISSMDSESGGRVQYPVSGEPLPPGESITFYRDIPYTQELELVDNDPFSAQLLNEAFDRGVMRDQQLQEQVDRAVKYDISTPEEDRLSPQELMRTISDARDLAVEAHAGAVEAEETVLSLVSEAHEIQTEVEGARDMALTAQSAAEEARDSAIRIAVGDITALRSAVPVLSGPSEAAEGTTVSLTISDHIEDGVTSYEVNTLGFGTASISGNIISWVLGTTGMDISKSIEVVRRRRGELYSDTAVHQQQVKYVPVQDGPTMAFADSNSGYPGATVDADGVHTPAHSVGADNINQVVSAIPEILVVNGKLVLLDGTTESILKLAILVAAGDVIITDKGECIVASVADDSADSSTTLDIFGDGSCVSCITFDGTVSDLGAYDDYTFDVSSGYTTGKFGQALNPPAANNEAIASGTNAIPLGEAFTISVWLKRDATKTSWFFSAESGDDYQTPIVNKNYGVYRENASTLHYMIQGGGIMGAFADPETEWYHCMWEVSATEANFYLNGEKKNLSPHTPISVNVLYSIYQLGTTQATPMDQFRVFNRILTAEEKTRLYTETNPVYTTTLVEALPDIPTKAVKQPDLALKVGAGVTGESLGQEIPLVWGAGSTTSELKFDSTTSLVNNLFVLEGVHNNIEIDGVDHKISGVNEVDNSTPSVAGTWEETVSSARNIGSVSGLHLGVKFVAEFNLLESVLFDTLAGNDYVLVGQLYTDVDGSPGSLIAETSSVTLDGSDQYQFAWETAQELTVGAPYWIVLEHQSGTGNPAFTTVSDVTGVGSTRGDTISNFTDDQIGGASEDWWFKLSGSQTEYITTATLETPLTSAPAGTEIVKIPDRCNLTSASYTQALDGEDLKITGAEIELEDNPDLKRLAMSVSGEGVIFKSGKIYIKEKL
ncbi:LamG-like jellyroll fold domain-containing protein [Maridesulfovibrio sp.]|uniref:LamG-like jellyroll fold domain-containing protein n=1 Tax=Maridesulfovibrio sp. TaxID=2795000 RepID=UPI0029CA5138|nr:LamG-like jellyroll fold domain-containing protein [Maridesulfovibrio sp.]